MKSINRILLTIVISISIATITEAQETMYIYKDGAVVGEHVLAEVDSVIFYKAEVPNENTVTDIDGNVYNTVVIGTQTWMRENLKTTKYSNGDEIGTTNPATLDISGESGAKYQWAPNADNSNIATLGRLYTWNVTNDIRGVCPDGWHVPNNIEWETLMNYLIENGHGFGGSGNDIAKSMAANSEWETSSEFGAVGNNLASNNQSGFSLMPSGGRDQMNVFYGTGNGTCLWSSDIVREMGGNITIHHYSNSLYISWDYEDGMPKYWGGSIRCLKD